MGGFFRPGGGAETILFGPSPPPAGGDWGGDRKQYTFLEKSPHPVGGRPETTQKNTGKIPPHRGGDTPPPHWNSIFEIVCSKIKLTASQKFIVRFVAAVRGMSCILKGGTKSSVAVPMIMLTTQSCSTEKAGPLFKKECPMTIPRVR